MKIPKRDLEAFARNIADVCMSSRQARSNRSAFYEAYAIAGSADPSAPAMFNKVYSSLDDLESLLFSPVSLRFAITDSEIPNVVNEAKGRAAASRIRNMTRQMDVDNLISQAVGMSLRKGIGITKTTALGRELKCSLVQPENFGVLHENHTKLDSDMEAFTHRFLINPSQFRNLIKDRPDETELKDRARAYMRSTTGGMKEASTSAMNIVTGGLYPFQPAGSATPNPSRGLVDWMSQPKPNIDPAVEASMMEMDEVYVWDDDRMDWAVFQIIGNDILIAGKYQIINTFSHNPVTQQTDPVLRGSHPFTTFCANPVPDYFWGVAEVSRLILLQEAINSRITGINRLLRKQEDPPTKFVGSTGVNQTALSRFNKPGGYWTDQNPNAKIERDNVQIPETLWGSLHEYERMFDEIMGLPPIAKGQGEAGVRSAQHAETLVRMFSPRFKDRALLIERDVEKLGALMLDLARAHIDEKLIAWVPKEQAGPEDSSKPGEEQIIIPPAKGTVPVVFTFADLPENVTLTVDSHSSSPAFSMEAKELAFNLVKIGAMTPSQLIDHVDAPDPDELRASIMRRDVARAEAAAQEQALKAQTHSGKKK
jgi:hypothetical protein